MKLFSKMWFAFFDEEFLQPKPKVKPPEKPQQTSDSEQYLDGHFVDEPDSFDWAELGEGDGFTDDDGIEVADEMGLDFDLFEQ